MRNKRDPLDVLSPFTGKNNESYTPVITRTDTFRFKDNDNEVVIPKRLNVIFAQFKVMHPSYTLHDMSDIINKWDNFPPTSVVKIKWHKPKGVNYEPSDISEEPYICAANRKLTDLWDFKYKTFFPLEKHPNRRLTDPELFAMVEDYIDPHHFEEFKKDQDRLSKRIILLGKDDMAKIPLQFNNRHPKKEYKNQAYLPYLISKHLVGNENEDHDMYLLICYIKDFRPLSKMEE